MKTIRRIQVGGSAALIALLAAATGAPAAVLEVPAEHDSLREALAAASPGDTIRLAAGTYSEPPLTLPGGITLLGDGPVTLDARHLGRHLQLEAGGEYVIQGIAFLNGASRWEKQAMGGSIRVGEGATATFRDCSFRNCSSYHGGGAIWAERDATLRLERCDFKGNVSVRPQGLRKTKRRPRSLQGRGGALYLAAGATLAADGCRFDACRATDEGGAIFISPDGVATLTDCTLTGNKAEAGGALSSEGGRVRLTACTFRANVVERSFARRGEGGAIRLYKGGSSSLTDCTFENNRAAQSGAVLAHLLEVLKVNGCRFFGNEAEAGASLHVIASRVEITDSVFLANRSTVGPAAAILGISTTVIVTGCTFHRNSSSAPGSAIAIIGASDPLRLERCLLTSNSGGVPVTTPASAIPAVSCTNVWGHEGGDWVGGLAGLEASDGNRSVDPLYVDPAADVALTAESPCIGDAVCGRIGAPGSAE